MKQRRIKDEILRKGEFNEQKLARSYSLQKEGVMVNDNFHHKCSEKRMEMGAMAVVKMTERQSMHMTVAVN